MDKQVGQRWREGFEVVLGELVHRISILLLMDR